MNTFEKFPNIPLSNEETYSRGKTPESFRLAFGALAKIYFGKIEVNGLEHFGEIPKDKKVIIAVSHVSDMDVPVAVYELGKYFDIVVTNQSVHFKFNEEALTNIGVRIMGMENFLQIDWKKNKDGTKDPRFNPENFVPMQEAMDNGKTIIMAAHNPSKSGLEIEGGGVGAVYLAQLSGAVILPVAVNIKSDKPLGMAGKELQTIISRPGVEVTVGKPIELEEIENIEFIRQATEKRESGEILSKEEIEEFKKITKQLKIQQGEVISNIAQMLPESKRGKYKDKETRLSDGKEN